MIEIAIPENRIKVSRHPDNSSWIMYQPDDELIKMCRRLESFLEIKPVKEIHVPALFVAVFDNPSDAVMFKLAL